MSSPPYEPPENLRRKRFIFPPDLAEHPDFPSASNSPRTIKLKTLKAVDAPLRKVKEPRTTYSTVSKQLKELEESLQKYRDALLSNRDGELSVLAQDCLLKVVTKAEDIADKPVQEHESKHRNISRVGKAIDRTFNPKASGGLIRNEKDIEKDAKSQRQVENLICDFFVFNGAPEVAKALDQEASLGGRVPDSDEQSQAVLESLKKKDVQPALAWFDEHAQHDIRLRADIHRQQVVEHISAGRRKEAIASAAALAALGYDKEVLQISGAALIPQHSRYKSLFSKVVWPSLSARVAQIMYQGDSKMDEIITVGVKATCSLIRLKQRMGAQQDHLFSTEELPCGVRLKRHVHNTFTCPILRQQSTDSNPPMRLRCGHVISRDALHKLTSPTRHYKVKCPYCPDEGNANDAKQIFFG